MSSPPSSAAASSNAKLVFGLGARTNRHKHDEYAEQRRKVSSSALAAEDNSPPASIIGTSPSSAVGQQQQLNQPQVTPTPTTTKPKPKSLQQPATVGDTLAGQFGASKVVKRKNGTSEGANKTTQLSQQKQSLQAAVGKRTTTTTENTSGDPKLKTPIDSIDLCKQQQQQASSRLPSSVVGQNAHKTSEHLPQAGGKNSPRSSASSASTEAGAGQQHLGASARLDAKRCAQFAKAPEAKTIAAKHQATVDLKVDLEGEKHEQQQQLHMSELDENREPQQQQQQKRPAAVRSRSKSPVDKSRVAGAATTTKKMVRRRSLEVLERQAIERLKLNKQEQQQQQQQQQPNEQSPSLTNGPKRMQFNVTPPRQVSMGSSNRGSVSYAKSRIYDRPTQSGAAEHQLTGGQVHQTTTTTTGNQMGGYPLPASIVSGIKPPKQVNVSKAREQWEGGEPFARCKSRQRLAAKLAATSNAKRILHGTWSITSVVATQQMQLQSALSASSSFKLKDPSEIDPSVKLLSRGSVLERVQQFERAPDAARRASSPSSLPASGSSCSLSLLSGSPASSLTALTFEDQFEPEAIDRETTTTPSADGGAPADHEHLAPGLDQAKPLSPTGTSKRAQYKSLVSTLQQQQQQQQQQALVVEPTASSQPLLVANGGGGGGQRPMVASANQQQRRLSLRRRSSLGALAAGQQASAANSLCQAIPRFYHPNGKPNTYEMELQKRNIVDCFDKLPERKAQLVGPMAKRHFHSIALACGFSEYFKVPLQLYASHKLDELIKHGNLGKLDNSNNNPQQANGFSSLSSAANSGGGSGSAPGRRQWRKTSTTNQMINTMNNGNSLTTTAPKGAGANNKSSTLTRAMSVDNAPPKLIRQLTGDDADGGASARSFINCDQFLIIWRQLISCAYDNAAKFIHLLTFGARDYLLPDDFVPLVQSIIDDHPGLKFLRTAPDFHMRYIQTVIARIYFCVNKSWTGKIKLKELRQSNLLAVLQVLSQEEEDINQITDYFSYEHFYVIYCKFWNLDQDHDLQISRQDLARHNDESISSLIIDRIFSSPVVSKQIYQTGKMSYSDFVWFLIAEEDKKHPRSVEYWFRLMDLDGDGYISLFEMEYFYYEQQRRLELTNIEPLPFLDSVCQILDLVNPKERNKISLADLKRTKMATIFFDTFINLEKYLEHESREFVSTRDIVQDGVIISDWDRYASEEYENLVTEESSV